MGDEENKRNSKKKVQATPLPSGAGTNNTRSDKFMGNAEQAAAGLVAAGLGGADLG